MRKRNDDGVTKEMLHELYEYRDGKLYHRLDRTGAKKGQRAGCKMWRKPYRTCKIKQKKVYEHRIIFIMHHGYSPDYVDHISDELTEDGIKDNHIENLRDISFSANIQKGSKRGKTSSYRGVTWKKANRKWCAQIRYNRKEMHIGLFESETDAARAYDARAREIYGDHAGVNFNDQ